MGDFLGFSRLEETTPPQYGFSCISLARRKTSHNNSAKAILDLSLKDLLLTSIDQDSGCAQIEFVVNISVEALGEMHPGPGGPIQSCSDCIYKCPRRFTNLFTSNMNTKTMVLDY